MNEEIETAMNRVLKALEAFERYGVDGIMVGRASFGHPWIFKEK